MIIDPFGEIIAECRSFDDSFVSAIITTEKIIQAGGYRYKKARRPQLYGEILSADCESEQVVIWLNNKNDINFGTI
jgi:hypothetical protein